MAGLRDLWVGLDTGEEDVHLCVIDDAGKPLFERAIRGTPQAVDARLARFKERISLVGIEASTSGILLARGLIDQGYNVSVFESRRASKFLAIRTNKTDLNDARGIADLARLGRKDLLHVHVTTLEMQRLRSSLATRQAIIRQRVAMEAIIRSKFVSFRGRLSPSWSQQSFRRHIEFAIADLKEKTGEDLAEELRPLADLCCAMRGYVESIDTELEKYAKSNSVCCRFMEIVGVGPLSALAFYSSICDPFRFKRNYDVGPYLGMVPRVYQSGQTSFRKGISKRGNRMVRTHLVTAAGFHLRTGDSYIQDWGKQLAERAGTGRARVAVARKLGVVMLAMWKTGKSFEARSMVGDEEKVSTS